MKIFYSFLTFFCLITSSIQAQQQSVVIKSFQLTDQVYMLRGQGGNIGLFVGADGVFMIDDQFARLTPKILKAIKNITQQPVDYLINTHWHGDHTGGNQNMAMEGALIVSHENVRKRMSVAQVIRGKKRGPSPKEALPVLTFSDDMFFHLNGDDILATHVHHAHTDGDVLVYFTKNNVLHMGDTYFNGKFPYIDLSSGGSVDGYLAALQKAMAMTDEKTIIIPGHGKVSNKAELKVFYHMLDTLRSRVLEAIQQGKTLEEVQNETGMTDDFNPTYGGGFISDRGIRTTFYRSLKKQ